MEKVLKPIECVRNDLISFVLEISLRMMLWGQVG